MSEQLKIRRLDINKRLKKTVFWATVCWLGAWIVVLAGLSNLLPIIEMLLLMFKVEKHEREFWLILFHLTISMLPVAIHWSGNYKINKIKEESRQLHIEEEEFLIHKKREEDKMLADEFLKTVSELSRREQMEMLNLVKDNLRIIEEKNNVIIDLDDDNPLVYVRKELEDMLFPSFDDENGYSKVRKK